MFRTLATRVAGTLRGVTLPVSRLGAAKCMSHKAAESDDQFDARYVYCYFFEMFLVPNLFLSK